MNAKTEDLEVTHEDGWVEITLQEAGVSTRSILQVENVSTENAKYRLGAASTSQGHTFEAGLFLRVDQNLYVSVPKNADARGVTFIITRTD